MTVDELETGPVDKRLESMVTRGVDAALTEIARELAGSKNPRMFRSKAARLMLAKGIRQHRAEKARTLTRKA